MNEDAENLEETQIEFKCPYCEKLVSFPNHEAGGPRDCPYCTEIFIIPQASTEFGIELPLPINAIALPDQDDPASFGPLGVGRISFGPFLQRALSGQAEEMLARWA